MDWFVGASKNGDESPLKRLSKQRTGMTMNYTDLQVELGTK
jgi:hypothetical protein